MGSASRTRRRRRGRRDLSSYVPRTDDAELEPVATTFAVKYGTGPWDFAARDGAFIDRGFGGRAIVFRVRPVRGLGFRKGDRFSQTTWRCFR